MRIIVYGVGAIGGTVAAALADSGQEVVGLARGKQLQAIRDSGLLLRTPQRDMRVSFPCYADPEEIGGFRPDDAIIMTMKTQDTQPALQRLRAAGAHAQPVFCAQNGVVNERFALRMFPNVYGITVMMPSDYVVPGEVYCHGTPKLGIFDIGRYPMGKDDEADAIAAALDKAGIAAFVSERVMDAKHGKLLTNLVNILEAALGPDANRERFTRLVRAEAEAVYAASGISYMDLGAGDMGRKDLMRAGEIAGIPRSGGSSTQSLKRGAGSIETDYLNGEIVLLGRLHGVPTPANAWLCELAARMVREKLKPGAISAAELEAGLKQAGAAT